MLCHYWFISRTKHSLILTPAFSSRLFRVGVGNRTSLANAFGGILDIWPNESIWDLWPQEVARHSRLNKFHSCALRGEISRRELFAKIPSLPLVLEIAFFQSLARIHDYRWGSEQRLTALRCLKTPVLWSRSLEVHAILCLLHQVAYQYPCSIFHATRKCHLKLLESLGLLQSIATERSERYFL